MASGLSGELAGNTNSRLLGTRMVNSAFHGTRLDVDHIKGAVAELVDELPGRLGAADRDDGGAFGGEIAAQPLGERLDGDLVTDALHEDDRARPGDPVERGGGRSLGRVGALGVVAEHVPVVGRHVSIVALRRTVFP